MFDPDFFPTPAHIVRKMLQPYRMAWNQSQHEGKCVRSILEPSAGKGDILDWIRNANGGERYQGPKLYAIEQSPELVSILQGKKYRVVGRDFLQFAPENRIDLIVMNPPFSDGARHLLHAWEILDSGDIVCLLNAETVRNPHTRERQLLLSIIEQYGHVEFLGQCFRDAERTTDVEVAMVRLKKVGAGKRELDFEFTMPDEQAEDMPGFADESTGSALMRPDQMGALIRQYDMVKKAFVDYLKAREAMAFYCQGVIDAEKVKDIAMESCGGGRHSQKGMELAFDTFKDSIRLKFWEHVLEKVGMEKYLTSDLRGKFREYIEQQGAMALTKENIGHILSTIMLNSGSIMQQAVIAVFDLFTQYHEENRIHVEGWKTNCAWKVGKKVILPNWVVNHGLWWSFSSYRRGSLSDIDKAMAYLSGKRIEDVETIEAAIEREWKNGDSGKCQSTFFEIRYFLKGTVHLVFRDMALWERFNISACTGKGWIGKDS